jgi:hypothetical protein
VPESKVLVAIDPASDSEVPMPLRKRRTSEPMKRDCLHI